MRVTGYQLQSFIPSSRIVRSFTVSAPIRSALKIATGMISRILTSLLAVFFCVQSSTLFAQWQATSSSISPNVRSVATISPAGSVQYVLAATDNGIYRTTDDGTTWTQTSKIPCPANSGFIQLGTVILAATDSGVYRSGDDGASWTVSKSGMGTIIPHGFVLASDGSLTNVYAAATGGVFLSTDAGQTWSVRGLSSSNALAIARNGTALLVAVGQGVFASIDGGMTWTAANTGLLNKVAISITTVGQTSYCGTNAGSAMTTNNGTTWTPDTTGMGFATLTGYASRNSVMFASTFSGFYFSANLGAIWKQSNVGLPTGQQFLYGMTIANGKLFLAINGAGVYARSIADFGLAVHPSSSTLAEISVSPNPSEGVTTVHLTNAERTVATITLTDLLGREIASLFHGMLEAGNHAFVWQDNAPAGKYFCVFEHDGARAVIPIERVR